MIPSSGIIINNLVLVGRRKNYVVPFHPGVNIIYGDSSTGKSSIIELINYLLGSSKFIYDEEIESSVLYAMLELKLGGEQYVIKRDIFDPTKNIEVYQASLENIDSVFPKKLSPKYIKETEADGYFSDFLLTALNMPLLRVRQAPTQADSKMVRLSFRDVFKYCYLNQDEVGSKQLLGLGNWSKTLKNHQTFKYIFNLLDTQIADLEEEISGLSQEQNQLRQKYKAVSDFLRETEFDTAINLSDSYEELEQQANLLDEELRKLSHTMVADSDSYAFLKDTRSLISSRIFNSIQARKESELAIERYTRLKNDYKFDIDKLKAISVAAEAIGKDSQEQFACPICETELNTRDFLENERFADAERVNYEVTSLVRRMKDLNALIDIEKGKFDQFSKELLVLQEDDSKARRMLDEESATMISPYLSQRDGLSSELAGIREKMKQLQHFLKIRNQQNLIFKTSEELSWKISRLQETLNNLRKLAPSLDAVANDLGDLLNGYLKKVGIKDRRDVTISTKTLLPTLRNRDYLDITSGGMRTILSIGHFASLLEYSLDHDVNFPRLVMIDTVGKYLAKTQAKYSETDPKMDTEEGVSDPSKYTNIYEHLIDLSIKAEDKGATCQFILVDNDVPESIQREYQGFIVAHYSSTGEDGLARGLIDDIGMATN